MFRKLPWVFIALFLFPVAASAAEKVQVLMTPFHIHAERSPENLKKQIMQLLEQRLVAEGVFVKAIEFEEVKKVRKLSEKDFRELGRSTGSDFVVWGSFTQIGKRFSLDVELLETYSDDMPEKMVFEGYGAENIVDRVSALAKDIALSVLRLEKVTEVAISGNKRIESEAIKRILKSKEGDLFSAKSIRQDIKAVYKMGYFGDVRVDGAETLDGKVLTFFVEENETVRSVQFDGNRRFDDEKIEEVLGTKPGAIMNVNTLQGDLTEIIKLYKEKGYHNVVVQYEKERLDENHIAVVFNIKEGEKIYVREITFEGNVAYDDDDLQDLIQTKEKGFFSWITSSGDLDREVLEQDISRIASFYHNHGYIQARVGSPDVAYESDKITIAIKVEEGPQFTVGNVAIEGDLIDIEEALLAEIKIAPGEIYNREVVREDILTLTDLYSDQGYAYADVSPRIEKHETEHLADIVYVINKRNLVYFEKIIITGNTKTRDKVIRRELNVYEQELFSGKRLKAGTRNLYRLEFFEDIKVDTSPGSSDDTMVLKIGVTEKPTGSFSFGGGYSTVDNLFGMISIKQRNFLGRSQQLTLSAQLGARTTQFTFSFTEPWLFDMPLSAGIDIYNQNRDYDTYDKDSVGGTVRFSYPVFAFSRAFFSYNYDRAEIENLTDNASSSIKEFEGTNIGHTISTAFIRDTRDRLFNPTVGSENSINIKHAGTPFGGDIGFTKYQGESGWYFPLFWKTVGFVHGKVGFIHGDSTGKVPTWERFYMGGINSIRGYDWRDISPRDPLTNDPIGGNKMVQGNVEFLFPLIPKAGMRGVLFYDTGNVYDNGEEIDLGNLRESTGFGIRWYSPIGPIRLEYGYILDSEKRGEGGWEFSMGSAF